MAERDETPVKVTLEIKRLYRAKDEDTEAIEVGPGEATVPAWVATELGLSTPDAKPSGEGGGGKGEATPTKTAPAVPRSEAEQRAQTSAKK